MKNYFLTIRKHQVLDYVSVEDLLDILQCLKKDLQFIVISFSYETDPKYDQLHAHLIIKTKRSVYYKKHSSINGFRLYFVPIYNSNKTLSYMNKDSTNKYEQEQIIITNYYRHHYAFIQNKMEALDPNGNDFKTIERVGSADIPLTGTISRAADYHSAQPLG